MVSVCKLGWYGLQHSYSFCLIPLDPISGVKRYSKFYVIMISI